MRFITNIEQLQDYKKRLLIQKEFLVFAIVFSEPEKELMNACYDEMLKIVNQTIANQTEVVEPEIINPNAK